MPAVMTLSHEKQQFLVNFFIFIRLNRQETKNIVLNSKNVFFNIIYRKIYHDHIGNKKNLTSLTY